MFPWKFLPVSRKTLCYINTAVNRTLQKLPQTLKILHPNNNNTHGYYTIQSMLTIWTMWLLGGLWQTQYCQPHCYSSISVFSETNPAQCGSIELICMPTILPGVHYGLQFQSVAANFRFKCKPLLSHLYFSMQKTLLLKMLKTLYVIQCPWPLSRIWLENNYKICCA